MRDVNVLSRSLFASLSFAPIVDCILLTNCLPTQVPFALLANDCFFFAPPTAFMLPIDSMLPTAAWQALLPIH